MLCITPVEGFRNAKTGTLTMDRTEAGVHPAVPIQQVACGQCMPCRITTQQDLVTRCVHETIVNEKTRGSAIFATLTYRTEDLNERRELIPKDTQDFNKRVRSNVGPFRFLQAAEYGPGTLRPHHHYLAWFPETNWFEGARKVRTGNFPLFEHPRLNELWGHGYIHFGRVDVGSARYVSNYTLKKSGYLDEIQGLKTGHRPNTFHREGPRTLIASGDDGYTRQWVETATGLPMTDTWEVQPEFQRRSTGRGDNRGLGHRFYTRHKEQIFGTAEHPNDNPFHIILTENGSSKTRVPAYYMDLLEKDDPELYDWHRERRKEVAKQQDRKWIKAGTTRAYQAQAALVTKYDRMMLHYRPEHQ